MQRRFLSIVLGAGMLLSAQSGLAADANCVANSSKHRVALLELYTSEGCSSCPPADAYLSQLESGGISRDKLVPLSLHVDYWNYIGWRDPFSDPVYTKRQREIALRNRLSSMYTPQMVLNGADYRAWRRSNLSSLVQQLNNQQAGASIKMDWQPLSAGKDTISVKLSAELASSQAAGSSVLHAMLFENNLVSTIDAGENNGRTLKHDYVVRQMQQAAFKGAAQLDTELSFNIDKAYNPSELGVAVFVQDKKSGEVVQAMASALHCQR